MINNTHNKFKLIIIALILPIFTLATNLSAKELDANFKVVDINGKVYNTKNTKGKFLVLNFWATWCPPCIKEMPEISEFYDENKDSVLILGMNYQALDDRNEVTDFTDSFGVEYPNVLYIDNLKPFEKFVIRVLPTTIIYDKNGKELINYEGLIDKPFLQHTILNHK